MKNFFSRFRKKVDFAGEVLRSAETPDKVVPGKTTYSAAGYELFTYCPRAYFYRYYAAQGGWDPYAGEFARKVFRLKYMRTLEGEAARILSESLSRMLFHYEMLPPGAEEKEGATGKFLEKWKYFTSREVWKMGRALEEELWRNDPKMPDFLELHGENPLFHSPGELMDYLIEELRSFFHEVREDSLLLPTLARLPRESFRSSLCFRDLTVENIPIVLPPFLLVLHKGVAAKLSFSFRFSDRNTTGEMELDSYGENFTLTQKLFALFASRTFSGHTPEIWDICWNKGKLSFHPRPVAPLSLTFLQESAAELFSFSGKERFLSPENFPCRKKKENCHFCRYFSLCRKEKG